MSLKLIVGKSRPRGFWMMDATSPLKDYSGYNDDALSAGNTKSVSLVNGAMNSLVVSNSSKAYFPARVFIRGTEHKSFSLEAWVRPVVIDTPAPQQVIGNDGSMDGIVIDGTRVSFITKFSSGVTITATYNLGELRAFHVVGTYSEGTNHLYVDGELVATESADDDADISQFFDSGQSFSSGSSTSSSCSLLINAVAVYEYELTLSNIVSHYQYGFDALSAQTVSVTYGGTLIEFNQDTAGALFEYNFSTDADWHNGLMSSVGVSFGDLVPESIEGVSQGGYWEAAVPLDQAPQSYYAATVRWMGEGVTVEASPDSENWTVVENGVRIPFPPPSTQTMCIRVTFESGKEIDKTWLSSISLTLFPSNTMPPIAGREVVLVNTSPENDYAVKSLADNWGAEMRNGSITIKSNPSADAVVPKTIEVWAKKAGTNFADNLITASPARWRANGDASHSYRTGEWQLRHYVFPTGFSGDIVFSGTGQIGHVSLYPNELSNDQIKEIYSAYVGVPVIHLNHSVDVVRIHEFPEQVDLSEYEWTVETSG